MKLLRHVRRDTKVPLPPLGMSEGTTIIGIAGRRGFRVGFGSKKENSFLKAHVDGVSFSLGTVLFCIGVLIFLLLGVFRENGNLVKGVISLSIGKGQDRKKSSEVFRVCIIPERLKGVSDSRRFMEAKNLRKHIKEV